MIPVIDIFAGPGGLGEGFSALLMKGKSLFKIALSVEMEENARQTLKLRSFFRQFERGDVPEEYYACLAGRLSRENLYSSVKFKLQAASAEREAMQAELGKDDPAIRCAITRALKDRGIDVRSNLAGRPHWVLIGGPPCQAYSLVGRSRMRGRDPAKYAADPRHTLYL